MAKQGRCYYLCASTFNNWPENKPHVVRDYCSEESRVFSDGLQELKQKPNAKKNYIYVLEVLSKVAWNNRKTLNKEFEAKISHENTLQQDERSL